ncbi:hypothetical protein V1478_001876 [Vespula squamosa]|uniref:Single-stranded DNA-binding protein, mitochondrial n=1 Tax=Vespula squamosa TaxID=30214 RepID=A0ABD2BYG4_VESSQ
MFHKVISRVLGRTSQLNNIRFFSQTFETSNMEKTINQITLLGRVGGAPQERGTEKHPVVIFSVATHFNYKYENGEYLQKTDWHRICVFKPNLRESICNYMKKGHRVLVNGRLSYGEFKDDEGNTKSSTSVIADDVIFFQ